MPLYVYKGYDIATGANRKGKVEADSVRAARQKLKSREKIIASELKEELVVKKGSTKKLSFGQKVSLSDLSVMTRQFATLQRAHVPLDDCLKALTQQVENLVLRNSLSAVKDSVSEGKSLAEAMHAFPNIYNRLYVNMVRAGESSGNLGLVLERLADFQEYQVAIQGRVFSALTYPLVMILANVAIISYLFVSVVPKLEKVFASLKVTLPWYSLTLINFSHFLQANWPFVFLLFVAMLFALKGWYASDKGRMTADKIFLRAPVFGAIVMRVNISKFTKTLSTLLSSGVPIISALEITKNVISNKLIADVVEESKKMVQEGDSLWVPIEKSGLFPPLVSHMIRTGEKTGELEAMLSHVADAYDAEVERKISAMIALIEPLMIILMAGVVVVVVLAMLVPMLSVMSQVR